MGLTGRRKLTFSLREAALCPAARCRGAAEGWQAARGRGLARGGRAGPRQGLGAGHSPAAAAGQARDRQELAEAPCPRARGWSPTARGGRSGAGRSPAASGLGAEGGEPWAPAPRRGVGRWAGTHAFPRRAGPAVRAPPPRRHCRASQVWGVERYSGIQANTTFSTNCSEQIFVLHILKLRRQKRTELNDGLLPLQRKIAFCTLWQTGGLLKAGKGRADFFSVSERRLFCQRFARV